MLKILSIGETNQKKWQKYLDKALDEGFDTFIIEYVEKESIDPELFKFKILEGEIRYKHFGKTGIKFLKGHLNEKTKKILKKETPYLNPEVVATHIIIYKSQKRISFYDSFDVVKISFGKK